MAGLTSGGGRTAATLAVAGVGSGGGRTAGMLAGFALAGVFVWAGAAKLARPAETAAGFAALGLPAPGVVARTVTAVELALAAALVAAPRIGGVAALVLLAGFSLVLLRALGSGSNVGCHCFGRARAEPVSRRDLARNAALAALALVAALAGPA